MFAKCISVLVLVVYVTGPMVSSANSNQLRPFNLPAGPEYSVCAFLGYYAKDNWPIWRSYVEAACSLQKDKAKLIKCNRTVGEYFNVIANKSTLDFCKQANITNVESKKSSFARVQGDHSVCKYLVGYANSVGAPSKWLNSINWYCYYYSNYNGTTDRAEKCEKTVAKHLSDFQKQSPEQFCSEHNLIDIQ